MKPLAEFTHPALVRIRGVLCDIDDTLTTEGRLTAAAYAALERLQGAGLLVVPITGRPAGWCDHIARMWPVDAIVGENGAFYFRYDRAARTMRRRYVYDDATLAANREKLAVVRDRILKEVPGCAMASDQHYRVADLAIDYCEDVPALSPAAVDKIVSLMQAAGLTAKVSSIHVNGWFGDYDKLSMARRLMHDCFDIDLDAQKNDFIFVGDSPNDAPMFAYFPHAVGVANIRAFAGRLAAEPAYVTRAPGGAGFEEVADLLLTAR
ncbi:MAG: family hydrolase [Betaproteobacteria bacterium]|nr:family hydrolase [Betaproteobacteria bacterium]